MSKRIICSNRSGKVGWIMLELCDRMRGDMSREEWFKEAYRLTGNPLLEEWLDEV